MAIEDMNDALDAFAEQHNAYRTEGRAGLKTLCKVARAIGYRDPSYFGQLDSSCAIGDLIEFLEDNSGAVEAILDWIRNTNAPEHLENITEVLDCSDDEEENEDGE